MSKTKTVLPDQLHDITVRTISLARKHDFLAVITLLELNENGDGVRSHIFCSSVDNEWALLRLCAEALTQQADRITEEPQGVNA